MATSEATRPLVSAHAAVASVLVGLTTATILFCSHFHQMAGDKAAGKKSPIVRLGSTTRALRVAPPDQSIFQVIIRVFKKIALCLVSLQHHFLYRQPSAGAAMDCGGHIRLGLGSYSERWPPLDHCPPLPLLNFSGRCSINSCPTDPTLTSALLIQAEANVLICSSMRVLQIELQESLLSSR